MKRCKQCNQATNNGTNFCNKKCRKLWQRSHEIRGAKKRDDRAYEDELMSWSPKFDRHGNTPW